MELRFSCVETAPLKNWASEHNLTRKSNDKLSISKNLMRKCITYGMGAVDFDLQIAIKNKER